MGFRLQKADYKIVECLVEINDIDAASFHENERLHLRIPAACQVTEMGTRHHQLLKCDLRHSVSIVLGSAAIPLSF